ncbi:MG2 domain-containing protein, partial [Flavobacterium sp. XS1P32]
SIQRLEFKSNLEIKYDGSDFDIDQKGTIDFPITALKEFKIVKTEIQEGDNQTVSINFSEPLEKGQDFKGLVAIQNTNNLKFSVQGNVLKVYFSNEVPVQKPFEVAPEAVAAIVTVDTSAVAVDSALVEEPEEVAVMEPEPVVDLQKLTGELLLEVFQGIESEYGGKLSENYAEKISFDEIKPSIRFIKNGTILPSSNNLKLNFEAVNLSAVDVKVYKIYKNNIMQFLQYNELNGSQNLKRVAQPIAKSTLNLKENTLLNLSKWNTFALDLSKIITPEPGAIYRVEFVYKKKYSLYKCETADEDSTEEEEEVDENDVNYSGNSYDDYYYDDYEWRESQDPCSSSYFYNAKIATNILATDLGVIAKRGENKSYLFAVNNIVTTEPVTNARVDLYTFQQQKITTGTTNSDGIATFQLDKFAYFAIVTQGTESTYVKLDDGNSLSVSNFNVSGETLQKGLKGFIYGERGVWRPGDNLYLSFILNDASNKIPLGHPIKFRLTDPNGKVTYQTVQKSNEWNHYAFTVPTENDAPTGNWEAMVSVGGAK